MTDNKDKNVSSKLQDSTRGVFKQWNDKATIKQGDSLGTIAVKILIRIGGILAMIAASPLILMAFIIAFLVAL